MSRRRPAPGQYLKQMISLPVNICVIRPQWVNFVSCNGLLPDGTKQLHKSMLFHRHVDHSEQTSAKIKKYDIFFHKHYNDVIMGTIASQITSITIVYSTVYSGADQRKPQSSASLALVREIHQWPVNSPHKWSVTRKMFPFDDVIMKPTGKHLSNSNQFLQVSMW